MSQSTRAIVFFFDAMTNERMIVILSISSNYFLKSSKMLSFTSGRRMIIQHDKDHYRLETRRFFWHPH